MTVAAPESPVVVSVDAAPAPADVYVPPAAVVQRLAFRALLPVERPSRRLVLLGASSDVVRAVRASDPSTEVDDHLGSPGTADIVVVLSDSDATVDRADAADVVRELSSDGVVWWETDRRRRGQRVQTPNRVTKALLQHGLAVEATYGIRPEPARPEWYVPLGHPGTLSWFLDNLYVPRTTRQMATEAMLRLVSRLGPRVVSVSVPFHAVVARRLDSRERSSAQMAPRALVAHGGERAILFGFGDGLAAPDVVAKVAAGAAARPSLVAEHEATSEVRRHVGAPLDDTIPASSIVTDHHGASLVQSVMGGRSSARVLGSRLVSFDAKVAHLHAVVRWIGDLHSHPIDADHRWDRCDVQAIAATLCSFENVFTVSKRERLLFDHTLTAAVDLVGRRVPMVWEHGDLTPWNVVMDGDTVRIVDWELARVGWPLADVLRFTDQWHAAVCRAHAVDQRAEARHAIVRPVVSNRPATAVVRAAIDGYTRRLGLPPELEDVLHVACLAELALRQDDKARRRGREDSGNRSTNPPATTIAHLADAMVMRPRRGRGET